MVYEPYIFDLLTLHAHGEKVVASSVHSGPTSCLESRRGKKDKRTTKKDEEEDRKPKRRIDRGKETG